MKKTHPNNYSNFSSLIHTLDISQEMKQRLLGEVNRLKEESRGNYTKYKEGLSDKETITNVLSEAKRSLEEKNKELTLQAKELEKQTQFKEKVFANVSHELRTPLHGILGMSHLLNKTSLNTIQKDYVDTIKGSADNLLVIVNDILNLSEMRAGEMKINKKPFSLHQFLKDLERVFFVKTKEKNIQLSFLTPANIPEYIVCDPTRLYQILLNILNNAIKFTHEGYIRFSTEVIHQEGVNVHLQFEIKDTGIGMEKDKLSKIFESFTRVHEDKGIIYEGSGLGLNIVKNLLGLLEGEVSVESEINKGTTFKVNLPVSIPSVSAIETLKNEEKEITVPQNWSTLKFLMIEDNRANILYSKDIFESWNLDLDIAPCLEDAQKLLEKPYDCIFSDVILPDGNGLDFIALLRKNNQAINQNTPVIILTASSNEKGAEQARVIDVQSYLSKPFPPELLIKKLKNIFNSTIMTNSMTQQHPKLMQEKEEYEHQQNQNDLVGSVFLEKLSKRFKGRKGLMVEMSKIFLDQAAFILPILEECHQKEDYEAIRFEAHKFKSTVNIIGLDNLRAFAAKTEEVYYGGKPSIDTQPLLNDFIQQVKTDVHKVTIAIEVLMVAEAA